MDSNSLGKHCALQSCNVLDFLPIQCSCLQWFCKLHITPDLHDCPSVQQQQQQHSPESSSTALRPKCAVAGCNKPTLATGVAVTDPTGDGESVPRSCSGCPLSFCVAHRHRQSHSCAGLAVGKDDDVAHGAARAMLARPCLAAGTPASHTPVVTRRPTTRASDPTVLGQLQKVNRMTLRHKAVPADPKDRGSAVPVDQRVHVVVRLEILGQSKKDVVLWFRKTTVTGRALDLVVQHFGVSHTVSTLRLERLSAEIGSHVLQNHLELGGQLEDGSTVVLTDSCSNGES